MHRIAGTAISSMWARLPESVRALLLLTIPSVMAFSSISPDSPHDDITEAAALASGYPSSGIQALQEAVRAPDLTEFRPEADFGDGYRIDARDAFRPEHHCDRVPSTDNQTAFRATANYIQKSLAEARAWQDAQAAVGRLGAALHALQDCFSHSNHVDLDAGTQDAFTQALLDGADMPEGVVLTAFQPHTENTTNPADPYPHDAFAKDSAEFNAESQIELASGTKFDAARQGAIKASTQLLERFLAELNETQLESLAALDAIDGAQGARVPLPGVLVVVAMALALRMRH